MSLNVVICNKCSKPSCDLLCAYLCCDIIEIMLCASHLVTDISCELDEIVFDGYVPGPCDILPSAAYVTDLSDQGIVEVVQQTLPPGPVLSMST